MKICEYLSQLQTLPPEYLDADAKGLSVAIFGGMLFVCHPEMLPVCQIDGQWQSPQFDEALPVGAVAPLTFHQPRTYTAHKL